MKELILAGASVALLAAVRQFIKSYRAKKAIADAVVDAVEAGLDSLDKK